MHGQQTKNKQTRITQPANNQKPLQQQQNNKKKHDSEHANKTAVVLSFVFYFFVMCKQTIHKTIHKTSPLKRIVKVGITKEDIPTTIQQYTPLHIKLIVVFWAWVKWVQYHPSPSNHWWTPKRGPKRTSDQQSDAGKQTRPRRLRNRKRTKAYKGFKPVSKRKQHWRPSSSRICIAELAGLAEKLVETSREQAPQAETTGCSGIVLWSFHFMSFLCSFGFCTNKGSKHLCGLPASIPDNRLKDHSFRRVLSNLKNRTWFLKKP